VDSTQSNISARENTLSQPKLSTAKLKTAEKNTHRKKKNNNPLLGEREQNKQR